MQLIRYQKKPLYDPAVSFGSLREEMDRLFDLAFPALGTFQRNFGWNEAFPVDLYQDKDAFVLRAELPGFRKEDLRVDVADGILTLTAHRVAKAGEDDQGARPEERVSRAISLPEQADAAKIAAAYENGVLTVTLPKREETKPRQITVQVS